jgi:hypothetical protein
LGRRRGARLIIYQKGSSGTVGVSKYRRIGSFEFPGQ